LRSLLRRAPIIPESAGVETLLSSLKRFRLHMAVVIDEYGGMAGIVTLEDLVEEVVGEVQDEFDQEIPLLRQIGQRELILRGDYPLDDLQVISPMGDKLPDVNSVGGLIVSLLDRMPQVGDHVALAGIQFVVETVSSRAVQTVRVLLPTDLPSHD